MQRKQSNGVAWACARGLLLGALVACVSHGASAAGAATLAAPIVIDSGDDPSAWTAVASPGSTASIATIEGAAGGAVGIRFDLGRGRTHVIARRAVSIDLPDTYRFVFAIRGSGETNVVEIKLISGENVWWWRRAEFDFPSTWKNVPVADGRIAFAWGPAGGGRPKHVDAIEIAVTAGSGGDGSLFLDEIRLEPRAGDAAARPAATVSSNGGQSASLLDGDPATAWRSAADDPSPSVVLDFHDATEQGGLVIEHAPDGFARAYSVDASLDAAKWHEVRRFTDSDGGTDDVFLPDVYARFLRLRFAPPGGNQVAIREIRVEPFETSESANSFFTMIARRSARGLYPRYFTGEQSYWTITGAAGGKEEALVNEEGSVEVDAGAFTLEPFVFDGNALRTWNDTRSSVGLEDGDLPMPTVTRHTRHDDAATLSVTAFVSGAADAATLYVRYRIAAARRPLRLFVAVRPFQVLPPWQALNRTGGVTGVRRIARHDGRIVVDGRTVAAVTPPDAFGAASFEQGDITKFLLNGRVPAAPSANDAFARASAAFAWDVPAGAGPHDVWLAVPWLARSRVAGSAAEAAALLDTARRDWRTRLDAGGLVLPAAVADWARSLRSNLAYVLINRDGPAIQPGSRNYERSWIRDGAMTSAALLELGRADEAKAFLRWYADFVADDGWVPCCVDARGADPVPEHDSFGEFIWGVGEVWRFTRDDAFVKQMWPKVRAAAGCMSRLRAKRTTAEFDAPEKIAMRGLLPESISHEGYSARPVHSYWDQAFALRGFADAAMLANVAADREAASRFSSEAAALERALGDSIRRTMDAHDLDFVPASAELADFDPTSTAVAFLLGTEGVYPPDALARSFDKYVGDLRKRSGTRAPGVGYTAYELRSATALVLLGRKAEAIELLGAMVADQRPPAWRQWPEISWLVPTEPSFVGDLPHTWIGSSFVHAVRTLVVAEQEKEGSLAAPRAASLLVGAGIPLEWLDTGEVRGDALPTWFGTLSIAIRRMPAERPTVAVELAAARGERSPVAGEVRPFTPPEGGIVVAAPFGLDVDTATIDGVAASVENNSVHVRQFPATVVFEYRPRPE